MPRYKIGFWDCPFCGKKKISADKKMRFCPGCGAGRPNGLKYYMDETSQYADESYKHLGPDWGCNYCGQLNPYENEYCQSCGASKENTMNYFELNKDPKNTDEISVCKGSEIEKVSMRNCEKLDEYSDDKKYIHHEPSSFHGIVSNLMSHSNTKKEHSFQIPSVIRDNIKAIIVFSLLIFTALFCLIPRHKTIHVIEKFWERSIAIEEYRTVTETGRSIPPGGRYISDRTVIDHYEEVLDHYEDQQVTKTRTVLDGYDTSYSYVDKGDGYFEEVEHSTPRYRTETYTENVSVPVYRDEPVYATEYTYDIDKWVYARSVYSNGDYTDDPYWPEYSLLVNEREGYRTEVYSVTADDEVNYNFSFDEWNNLEIGSEITIRYNIITKHGTVIPNE